MLGEASTTEIARKHDAQGLDRNRRAARTGGTVAGNARRELEAKSGTPVVSNANYLHLRGAVPAAEALPKKREGRVARKDGKA